MHIIHIIEFFILIGVKLNGDGILNPTKPELVAAVANDTGVASMYDKGKAVSTTEAQDTLRPLSRIPDSAETLVIVHSQCNAFHLIRMCLHEVFAEAVTCRELKFESCCEAVGDLLRRRVPDRPAARGCGRREADTVVAGAAVVVVGVHCDVFLRVVEVQVAVALQSLIVELLEFRYLGLPHGDDEPDLAVGIGLETYIQARSARAQLVDGRDQHHVQLITAAHHLLKHRARPVIGYGAARRRLIVHLGYLRDHNLRIFSCVLVKDGIAALEALDLARGRVKLRARLEVCAAVELQVRLRVGAKRQATRQSPLELGRTFEGGVAHGREIRILKVAMRLQH